MPGAPVGHPEHGGAPYGAPLPPPPMPPGAVPPPPGAVPPPPAQAYPDLTEGLVLCPICRSPQTGRFCEECGYDYELSTPSRRQPPAVGIPAPGPAQPPAPLNIPAAYGGTAQPPQPAQPQPQPPALPHTYGYPPPEGLFPDPSVREDSGPVYAHPAAPAAPVGPAGRGNDYGTSFHLAPPMPPQPQPEAVPPQAVPPQAVQPQPVQPEPVRANWIAVVAADREYFTEMMARSGPEAAGLFFPPYCPERRVPLTGRGQLRIGRRSQHRGTVPEIDLSVPPEDPGASHQHALLAEQADGSWVLVDQDSTNGTTVNGGAEPIAPHTAIPLNDGDRIHIGAWTTITVHRA
ncbi:FHA domain-containing protein [Kitasatospora sp. NPDC097643]|uniref:FHA domain-containing protein n=1 Tax=Kitasatospora sp. NPDC097643 TaxID=3157230 RepID=UPI003325DE16